VPPENLEAKPRDPFKVVWDGPDDPHCPLNKPAWRKWWVGS
jgi:hypothetical protein